MKITANLFKALPLLLVLALFACKHEPPAEPVDCGEATTIDEMMEWTYFKTGTYWIYREVNSGAIDTCTVYYDYNGIHPEGFSDFVMKIRSSYDGFTYEYWFNDGWSTPSSLRPGCTIRVVDCDKFVPGDYRGGAHVLPFPLFVGNRCGQDNGVVYGMSQIIGFNTTDTTLCEVFGETIEVQQQCSPQHGFIPSVYKVSKNIGIIQKTIPSQNEDWRIIGHFIIQ